VDHTYRVAKDQLFKFTRFLRAASEPLLQRVQPHLDPLLIALSPHFRRAKEFYQRHQLPFVVAAAVLATYLIVRPARADDAREKEKEKRKKGTAVRPQVGGKTFISDNSELDPQEEPSTGTRREVESSGREAPQRKKAEGKHLERIESSSEEEESGDKIFFEVYKTYQVSSSK
jgi:hypothetical protein